ncbi:MAG TPA: hypothetical protein VI819_02085 [Patescibacteria group bacterium]|nr:hypothetical protein [Patescibacteria group bacterium]
MSHERRLTLNTFIESSEINIDEIFAVIWQVNEQGKVTKCLGMGVGVGKEDALGAAFTMGMRIENIQPGDRLEEKEAITFREISYPQLVGNLLKIGRINKDQAVELMAALKEKTGRG